MALVGLSWRDIFAYPQMLPYKRRALTCLSSNLDSHSGEIEIQLAAEAEAVRVGEETRRRRREEEDDEGEEEDGEDDEEDDEDEDETSAVSKGFHSMGFQFVQFPLTQRLLLRGSS